MPSDRIGNTVLIILNFIFTLIEKLIILQINANQATFVVSFINLIISNFLASLTWLIKLKPAFKEISTISQASINHIKTRRTLENEANEEELL